MHCGNPSAAFSEESKASTYGPEVPDDLVLLCIPPVVCVLLPVFDIDICNTSNKQFQFAFIENIDKVWWNKLVETSNESVELFFNSLLNSPFGDKSTKGERRPDNYSDIRKTYSMYSFLFSLVTSIFLPSGFKSMVRISPKLSSSVENVGSITPSISFSLQDF